MTVAFHKYQGTGNDFVMIDDRSEVFDIEAHELIKKLCDRKFGIGADGLILIRNHDDADFEMVYYNADGYQTSLCGNGSRCAVQFAHQLGIVAQECTFQTIEGMLKASIKDGLITIYMPDVHGVEEENGEYFLNTGSPHHIRFVNDLDGYDVFNEGKKIRNSAKYASGGGSNVNFVQPEDGEVISVRTYERGVEDETFSCGTGVTAAAVTYGKMHNLKNITVNTLGGTLVVGFENTDGDKFTNVCLTGPAKFVYKGTVDTTKL